MRCDRIRTSYNFSKLDFLIAKVQELYFTSAMNLKIPLLGHCNADTELAGRTPAIGIRLFAVLSAERNES